MQPHIVFLLLFGQAQDWGRLVEAGLLYERRGQFIEAEQTFDTALQAVRRAKQPARVEALVLNNLGSVQVSLGRYHEGERTLKRAFVLFQENSDGTIEWTMPLSQLAALYHELGRLHDSQAAYRRVLTARRAALGDTDQSVARTSSNFAGVLISLRCFDEADQLLRSALEIFANVRGGELDRARALMNLAVLRTYRGRLPEAASAAEEGVGEMERALGRDHPSLGRPLLNLGEIYLRMRQNSKAERSLRRSVALMSAAYPANANHLISALAAHAEALRRCGNKPAANQSEKEAQRIAERSAAGGVRQHTVNVHDLLREAYR